MPETTVSFDYENLDDEAKFLVLNNENLLVSKQVDSDDISKNVRLSRPGKNLRLFKVRVMQFFNDIFFAQQVRLVTSETLKSAEIFERSVRTCPK